MPIRLLGDIVWDGDALLVTGATENGRVTCRVPRDTIHKLDPYSDASGPAPGSSNVRPALAGVRPFHQTRRGARSRRPLKTYHKPRNARPDGLILIKAPRLTILELACYGLP